MLLFIPRSLCALKRVAAKAEHARYAATQGIRIALASGVYRAEATDGHRAIIVQGLIPGEDPPWPGFKDLPDDACETIVLPDDLVRASKLGGFVQDRLEMIGVATMGNDIALGLGSDQLTARTVEGRFPAIDKVIPRKRPLFTFSFDPKVLAETLLAMAELLPDEARQVQCFYYGKDMPIGFCAHNMDDGLFIDALVVPIVPPKSEAKDKPAQPAKDAEPVGDGKDTKPDQPEPEAAQAPQQEPAAPEPTAPDAPPVKPSGTARARRGHRRSLEAEKGGTPS